VNFLQNWFKEWAPRVERYLFGAALIVVALIVLSQIIMTNARARFFLNRTESLEGRPYNWFEEVGPGARTTASPGQRAADSIYWIELGLRKGEGPLEVLCNGAPVGILEAGNLIVYVNPGDIIEVRGEITREQPAVIEVVSTRGLSSPQVGTQVMAYGDYDLIGWAIPQNGE